MLVGFTYSAPALDASTAYSFPIQFLFTITFTLMVYSMGCVKQCEFEAGGRCFKWYGLRAGAIPQMRHLAKHVYYLID